MKRTRLLRHRLAGHGIFLLSSFGGAVTLAFLLWWTGSQQAFDDALLDTFFRLRPAPTTPSPVTVVVLRGAELEPEPGRSPSFEDGVVGLRPAVAALLEQFVLLEERKRPHVVLLDVLLVERGVPDDPVMGRILQAAATLQNVVHPIELLYRPEQLPAAPEDLSLLAGHVAPVTADQPEVRAAAGVLLPTRTVLAAAAGVGSFSVSPAAREGSGLYTLPMLSALVQPGGGNPVLVPGLSLAGLSVGSCGPRRFSSCFSFDTGNLRLGESAIAEIPLSGSGEFRINYHRRFSYSADAGPLPTQNAGAGANLEVVHFWMGPSGETRFLTPDGRAIDVSSFAGQLLLVVDGRERYALRTPFGPTSPQSTVHAQVLANVLEQDFLGEVSSWLLAGLALLSLTVGPGLRIRALRTVLPSKPPATVPSWMLAPLRLSPELGLILMWCAGTSGAFFIAGLWCPPSLPVGLLAGGMLGTAALQPSLLRRQLRHLRAALGARTAREAYGQDGALRQESEDDRSRAATPSLLPVLEVQQQVLSARLAGQAEALERKRQQLGETASALDVLRTAPLREKPAGELLNDSFDAELAARTGIVTRDPGLIRLMAESLRRAARSSAAVLILGESGTGKELLARAIHYQSPRSGAPFEALNINEIPDGLFESELFGHTKGAFTGASADRQGRFQLAHGGTLFLDEIGDLAPHLQVKLLRVIQEMRVRPVGASADFGVDVRIIAATKQPLGQLMESGRFREDLYYRLNGAYALVLPPLRERPWDIVPLTLRFAREAATADGRPLSFDRDALEMLCRHRWPGNVRELRQLVLDVLPFTSDASRITAAMLGPILNMTNDVAGCRTNDEVPGQNASEEGLQALTPIEAVLAPKLGRALAAFRRNGFDYRKAAADPAYRETADGSGRSVSQSIAHNDLCVLRAIALEVGGWQLETAADLLIGASDASSLHASLRSSLAGWVEKQRKRQSVDTAKYGLEGLERRIRRKYEADAGHVLRLYEAIRDGRLPHQTPQAGSNEETVEDEGLEE